MVKTRKVTNKKRKNTKKKKTRRYKTNDYKSSDGMLTSVWGLSLWHFLHTMSFNYPVHPSEEDKKHYREFVMSLKYILPCKYCRINLKKNLKAIPLNKKALKNRNNFSKWMYCLHEHINKMLNKKSGLSYCDVRERYENFRARCTKKEIKEKIKKFKREKGCVDPLYGKKSKCVLRIIPKEVKTPTLKVDNKCKKF